MADKKISALTDGTTAEASDRLAVARDPDGTPLSRYITPAYLNTYISGVAQTVSGTRSFQANALFSPAAAGGFVVDISDTMALGSGSGTVHIRSSNSTAGGVNSAGNDLVIESSALTGMTFLTGNASFSTIYFGVPADTDNSYLQWGYNSGSPTFFLNNGNVENMRLNNGYFKHTNHSGYINVSGEYHEFNNKDNTSGDICMYLGNGGSNTENTSSFLLACNSGAQDVFYVYGNGACANATGEFDTISDRRIKEDIVDSNSQWDDIKKLKVRNYKNLKAQGRNNIGLVAQEVEQTSPGLVDERLVDGIQTKVVRTSVVYMKAVKALQEAIERIEGLEKTVAKLEKN